MEFRLSGFCGEDLVCLLGVLAQNKVPSIFRHTFLNNVSKLFGSDGHLRILSIFSGPPPASRVCGSELSVGRLDNVYE